MTNLLYFFYFLSGTTALIYELIWARKFGLIFGVDAYGIATVLSVFFIGLALGSWLFGKNVDRLKISPVKLYGLLEIGIAAYAALTPVTFKFLNSAQSSLFDTLGNPELFSFSLIVFLLSTLALIVPTTLMGATFPAAVKAAAHISADSTAGMLYGLNTLGAVIGTALAGFLLVHLLGANATTYLAALVNLLIGISALNLSKKYKSPINTDSKMISTPKNQRSSAEIGAHSPREALAKRGQRILLAIFFLTGFAALALEVLISRVLIITFGASTYAFATVLATFLLGIALGSILAERFIKKNLKTVFTLSLSALGILTVILIPLLGNTPNFTIKFFDPSNPSYWQNITSSAVVSVLLLIAPTILMGINFVLGLKIYLESAKTLAKDAGRLYSINTAGGVFGSFVAGFLLLPKIGAQHSIVIASMVYITAAAVSAFFIGQQKYTKTVAIASAVFTLALGIFLPSWNRHLLNSGIGTYYRDFLQKAPEERKKDITSGEILFYKEGVLATVMVKKAPEGYLFLRSNGKTDASTDQDLDDFKLLGHLPMILHPNPQKTLLVGIGSGVTAGAIALHKPEELVVVEIESAMVEAARYFGDYNHNVVDNPNVKIIQSDARAYLTSNQNQYDVIASQPSNPWVRGNANLFTREFFQIAKNSLKGDGLMMQWVQYYSFANTDFRSVLATFSQTFPYVTVWTPVASQDILLIGSRQPQNFDFGKIKPRVESEAVQTDLKTAAIANAQDLAAHYMFDQNSLKELTGTARITTDDKPNLEFTAPFNLNRQTLTENLSMLLSATGNFRDHLQNINLSQAAQIGEAKTAVNLILGGKIKAQNGQIEEAIKDYEAALKIMPKELSKKELASFYFELARQASQVNDITKMVSYFEKSVEAYPNANVYLNLSILYLQQNRIARATEALQEAKKLQPQNERNIEIERAINVKRYR